MIIAGLCFEAKEKTAFYKTFPSKFLNDLKKKIRSHPYLKYEKRFLNIEKLTALIQPCYYGKTIFDIMKNTNLLEGDIIRFLRQILDRIGQVRKSTKDERLVQLLNSCQDVILRSMEDLDVV